MFEIRLPSLGAEMDEGTLLEWYVKPGDRIEYGDVIALLDTDKAEIEMEAFEAGTIDRLLVEPGETVSVGTPIATIERVDRPAKHRESTKPARPEARKVVQESSAKTETQRVKATPLARRLAREIGVDLATLSGSGPGGAIVEADLPKRPVVADRERVAGRSSRRRDVIAAAMTRSKREIPHYYLSTSIAVQKALNWLAEQNRTRAADQRVVLAALLMKAVARAAIRFPEMNGHWLEDGFRPSQSVHLGMVVSLRTGGLVVPTFRDVEERPVADLMAELRDVVGRARAGRLRSGELSDATITVTSLGDDGADTIFGVIYPPQVSIVGFGGIHTALRAEGEMHGTQSVIRASLAADHRASDGQRGSDFLREISQSLDRPEQL